MKEAIFYLKEKKPISFSLDTLAKSIYISFSTNPVVNTLRKNNSFSVDYDKDGEIVGIEVIRIKKAEATIKRILKDTENSLPSTCRKTINSYFQSAHV